METIKQDMPPPGGFSKVVFERVPLKKYWPLSVKCLLVFGITGIGWVVHIYDKKRLFHEAIEKRAAKLSITPLLTAEMDRMRLKTIRKNRDAEAELMKDVEGWKVGKYIGEPVYKSISVDDWYEPDFAEYTAHAPELETWVKKYISRL